MNICPATSLSGVAVRVKVGSLSGVKLSESTTPGEVNFDVKVMMDEKERRSGQISVGYSLKVGTKPNVVKYEVEGVAVLEGKDEEIKKMLEVNPETEIPFVFQGVYQHVFLSIYLLATIIDAPYPPPTLLSSGRKTSQAETNSNLTVSPTEKTLQPPPTSTIPPEETAT